MVFVPTSRSTYGLLLAVFLFAIGCFVYRTADRPPTASPPASYGDTVQAAVDTVFDAEAYKATMYAASSAARSRSRDGSLDVATMESLVQHQLVPLVRERLAIAMQRNLSRADIMHLAAGHPGHVQDYRDKMARVHQTAEIGRFTHEALDAALRVRTESVAERDRPTLNQVSRPIGDASSYLQMLKRREIMRQASESRLQRFERSQREAVSAGPPLL